MSIRNHGRHNLGMAAIGLAVLALLELLRWAGCGR